MIEHRTPVAVLASRAVRRQIVVVVVVVGEQLVDQIRDCFRVIERSTLSFSLTATVARAASIRLARPYRMPHTNSQSGKLHLERASWISVAVVPHRPRPSQADPRSAPHTARDRKASRSGRKPAFLQKKAKSSASKSATNAKADALGTAAEQHAAPLLPDPSIPKGRQDQTTLIRRFHAIEKQLASPALTDPEERKKLELEREQLGGLETYQAASQHGGDKVGRPPPSLFLQPGRNCTLTCEVRTA